MATTRWALRLSSDAADSLRRLRLRPELTVCRGADGVWLRGPSLDAELELALRALPADARYRCDAEGFLYPPAGRLPVGSLPSGPWEDLRAALPLSVQPSRGAAVVDARVPLTLVPATDEREATLLLTTFAAWQRWALLAPELRLAPLSFAVDAEQRVLVRGAPLPPLPGQRFHAEDSVAAPCGRTWSPAVGANVVAEVFDLLPGELLLLRDERCDVLRESQFARATRSAVRETAEGLARG